MRQTESIEKEREREREMRQTESIEKERERERDR